MPLNKTLTKNLRIQLENTVKAARDVAEKAAHAALSHLGVGEAEAPGHLAEDQKALRRRLRAHGRQLGDIKHSNDTQPIRHLVWEVAYEHWHRMLFARFLAENHLLMWEPGAAVTLAECEELAQDSSTNLGAKSGWELAAILAARMLPQVFKSHSPVFELRFSPNEQRDLELLLKGLPTETFHASDSLGWVYQFWQAKRKDEVNASEVKIGADELPAVTQLFTEPYMVDFLLHNSLGAWWHTRYPNQACPVELTYFRALDNGTPAAGKFEGWPELLAEFTLLDPCCGSGHFLVAAFLLLVPMRMASEGLQAKSAVDAVLADNLHGLEIDPRCVEIAVFALALAAWRYPDESGNALGVRAEMPAPNIACCGLKVAARAEDWEALVPNNMSNTVEIRQELRLLHNCFLQAPLLGSLLDPSKTLKKDLASTGSDSLNGFLLQALSSELTTKLSVDSEDGWDLAICAKGLMEAAEILDGVYDLVLTNVPYLALRKQDESLASFIKRNYPKSQQNLAIVFIECMFERLKEGGVCAYVSPQDWLFLDIYSEFRQWLLNKHNFLLACKLGMKAFTTPMWDMNILLSFFSKQFCSDNKISGFDLSTFDSPKSKEENLVNTHIYSLSQKGQYSNPDARIVFEQLGDSKPLGAFANALMGISTGDGVRFHKAFWEIPIESPNWEFVQSTVNDTKLFGGRTEAVFWQQERGEIYELAESVKHLNHSAQNWQRGRESWGKKGVVISQMGDLFPTLYGGEIYDCNCCAVVPFDESHIPALWAYAQSGELHNKVRELNQALKVPPKTLLKIEFDLDKWMEVSRQLYANGLPKPYSDDPTQWIFHGHPRAATDPLQVGIARLLGYTWPAESDPKMEVSDEARTWIERCKDLEGDVDDDGIVCLRAVRGEKPAHERLLTLLINAWETIEPGSWKTSVLDKLLVDADYAGKGLDVWLQEKFFEQHAKLFQHCPFIWHVWDGLKDGFSALVNYHMLDTRNLERLIHTYLGDWIRTQEAEVTKGIDGAVLRLAAAQALKKKLEAILEGEAPFDIFVRWKSAEQQSIGWNPDLNDGVRMNIRPFMTAEVLRQNKKSKLNVTWDKDRGKDVETAPWFKTFKGERINDHHLTLLEKKAARNKAVK